MHSVIVGPVGPCAVLVVSCVLCLQVKLHRTLVAESCQMDAVSADVGCHLVTQLWPSSPGGIVALRIFVPSLCQAFYAQIFVRTVNISFFLILGRRRYILRI